MNERYRALNNLLVFIDRRRRQIGETAMGRLNILPSQHFALVALKHAGRGASQAQIADVMQMSHAAVARTMKGLDRDGYIQRSSCGADGRKNEIVITEKGEQVLRQSCALFQDLDARSFAGLSENELIQLGSMLDRVLGNLTRIKEEIEGEMKE